LIDGSFFTTSELDRLLEELLELLLSLLSFFEDYFMTSGFLIGTSPGFLLANSYLFMS
jgi:hypothetical protein